MADFREYKAAFDDHQNDLMHYGVKGMKWHKHLKGVLFVKPDERRSKTSSNSTTPVSEVAKNFKKMGNNNSNSSGEKQPLEKFKNRSERNSNGSGSNDSEAMKWIQEHLKKPEKSGKSLKKAPTKKFNKKFQEETITEFDKKKLGFGFTFKRHRRVK